MNKTPIFVFKLLLCLFVLGLLALPAQAEVEFVLNGGFETGDFTNWTTVDGGSPLYDVDNNDPNSGTYNAFFAASSVGAYDAIYQNVPTTTVPNNKYRVIFWLANDNAASDGFRVSWNGATLLDLVNPGSFGYTEYQFPVYGAGATTELRFEGYDLPSQFMLDDVSVVPEPSTGALAVIAIAGLGAMARRRKWRTREGRQSRA